jgi:hypothetical protein
VRNLAVGGAVLRPRKLAVIASFTREIAETRTSRPSRPQATHLTDPTNVSCGASGGRSKNPGCPSEPLRFP